MEDFLKNECLVCGTGFRDDESVLYKPLNNSNEAEDLSFVKK